MPRINPNAVIANGKLDMVTTIRARHHDRAARSTNMHDRIPNQILKHLSKLHPVVHNSWKSALEIDPNARWRHERVNHFAKHGGDVHPLERVRDPADARIVQNSIDQSA